MNTKIENKKSKGFTLVELIVVIGVLAILAVAAVVGFQGIQANARRATLSAEANMTASVLNNFNAVATAPVAGENGRVTAANINAADGAAFIELVVPAQGAMQVMTFRVDFDNAARRDVVLSYIDFVPGAAGAAGRFVVNTAAIQASDGIAIRGA